MNTLRKASFIIAISGMAVLLSFLLLPAKELGDLNGELINEKVVFSGKVESEREFGAFSILKINGINVLCDSGKKYLSKEVLIVGKVEEYNGKKQVRALYISENR